LEGKKIHNQKVCHFRWYKSILKNLANQKKDFRPPNRPKLLNLVRKLHKIGFIDNMKGRNKNISQKRKDAKIVLKKIVLKKPEL